MDIPIRAITGHLLWTTTGEVLAVYAASLEAPTRPTERQGRELLDIQTGVLKSLSGEAMIASLCPVVDPASIVARMIKDVDLNAHPEWAELAENTFDMLSDIEMTDRTHWLVLPLSAEASSPVAGLIKSMRLTMAGMGGPTLVPISPELQSEHLQLAARTIGHIAGMSIRPARAAEVVWWFQHCYQRGIDEPPLPEPGDAPPLQGVGRGVIAAISNVVLDEAARTDLIGDSHPDMPLKKRIMLASKRILAPLMAMRRRYLKVITENGEAYQSFLILNETPRVFRFPGSEWLSRLNEFGMPIDWVARLKIVPNELATGKTRKQSRELLRQNEEWSDHPTGVPNELVVAQEDVVEQDDRLRESRTEVDVQVSVVMCVWAETADEVEQRAKRLIKAFGNNDYSIVRPLGSQLDLFMTMLPGQFTPQVLNDYRQFFLAQDFAISAPFISHDLGDPHGGFFGFPLDTAGCRPVLLDPSYPVLIGASASLAVIAELGAGKSVILKKLMWELMARIGGRAIVLDRTPVQEYVKFARACPGQTTVVAVTAEPEVSMDPFRVFPPGPAKAKALSFYNALLDLPTSDTPGIVMRDAIGAVIDRHGENASSRLLIEELERIQHAPGGDPQESSAAGLLRKRLATFAEEDLGRIIFDDTLPPVDLQQSDAIVFATSEVPLPKREEVANEYVAARLDAVKLLGRAIHVLIAAIAHEVAFHDPRFTAFIADECYSFTSNPEGENFALLFVRDGRKHGAGIWMGGHDVPDVGNETIRGLISMKFLGRHRSSALAARGLDWLGVDGSDPELLKLVTTELSPLLPDAQERQARAGEFMMNDTRTRIGKVKVVIPPFRDVPELILTDPAGAYG